jgi:hypothetical protein
MGRDARTSVVETLPSRICTRTSTSVMVNCRPANSILSCQSAQPGVDPAPLDQQVRKLAHNGILDVDHAAAGRISPPE